DEPPGLGAFAGQCQTIGNDIGPGYLTLVEEAWERRTDRLCVHGRMGRCAVERLTPRLDLRQQCSASDKQQVNASLRHSPLHQMRGIDQVEWSFLVDELADEEHTERPCRDAPGFPQCGTLAPNTSGVDGKSGILHAVWCEYQLRRLDTPAQIELAIG